MPKVVTIPVVAALEDHDTLKEWEGRAEGYLTILEGLRFHSEDKLRITIEVLDEGDEVSE